MIPDFGRPIILKGPSVENTPSWIGYGILRQYFNVSYEEIWFVFSESEASEYGRHLVLTDPAIAAEWLE